MPSLNRHLIHPYGGAVALLATLALGGCDSQRTAGPFANLSPAFSKTITLTDFGTALGSGPQRVRVWLSPGTLIAKRVLVTGAEQMTRPERIDSRVNAIVPTTAGDTLVLALGDLKIFVNASTKFTGNHEDGDSDDPADSPPTSLADFTARIQAALAAGHHPALQARRPAPTSPQAPGDAAFVATVLRLDAAADHPKIEMNVAAANLIKNTTPPPDAWLQVLGIKIELRTSDGTTKIREETPETEGEIAFGGMVKSVDVTAKTATLVDGTILHIVAGTQIEGRDDPDDLTLASLADVQTALTAHDTVFAKGEGLLVTATPRTLDVIEVRFEAKEHETGPEFVAFADMVASADSVAKHFTLANGTVVNVSSTTHIAGFTTLHTLGDVQKALANHQAVRAEGFGTVASAGPPRVLDALGVEFETVP